MLRLFRSVRRRLLAQGRLANYLAYALGEIALVVVGILIALSLNTWKERRAQRAQELETLQQLREEFTANLSQLDEKIAMREAMADAAMRLLAYHDDTTLIVPDSMNILLGRTTVSPTFDPVTNDLITSGRLYLISDLDLRKRLSRWTSDLVQVTEEETAWIHINRERWGPFLRANYPMRSVNAAKWNGLDVVKMLMLDKEHYASEFMKPSERRPDLQHFFTLPELEDELSSVISSCLFANMQSKALRKNILGILERIDADLNAGGFPISGP